MLQVTDHSKDSRVSILLHRYEGARLSVRQIVATPGALKGIVESGEETLCLLADRTSGDGGDLDEYDRRKNELSLKHG